MATILYDAAPSPAANVPTWIRTPYGVRLSEDPIKSFQNLLEMEQFVMAQHSSEDGVSGTVAEWMSVLSDANNGDGILNKDGIAQGDVFYSKPNYTDTRVGGNDAINPYWQFNVDDDITPPSLGMSIAKKKAGEDNAFYLRGMGRVYSETYDANQQILWMSMGVPEYVNLISFYRDAGNTNAASAMNKGTLRGIAGTLIKFVFSATIWAITFPITAPFWINRWMSRIQTERISKYFYFKPAMVIYYEMVNTMLSYLAVSMGLYPQWIMRRKDSTKELQAQYAQMQGTPDVEMSAHQVNAHGDVNYFSSDAYKNQPGSPETKRKPPKPTPNSDAVMDDRRLDSKRGRKMGGKALYTGGIQEHGKDYGVGGVAETQDLHDKYTSTLIQRNNARDSGIPEILANGPDIFTILNRRALLFNANRVKVTTRMLMDATRAESQDNGSNWFTTPDTKYVTDKSGNVTAAADDKDANKTGAWAKTWSSLKSNMFGAGDYVGFRVERGVSCSESISNSTGPTGVAQKMNAFAQQQREQYENYGNSWVAKTVANLAKDPGGALKQVAGELAAQLGSGLGLGDIGAVLTQGNGFLDMPDVWKNSTFSRNYSINIPLRARYGDPVSIYQSIYIPLIMLLAASMPRSVGDSMYTSPFLIKAYCKGMFSIPCGIVESMSISRGKDEFGWSSATLPTSVDVSLSLKDLSPTFFLSMQDIGLFDTFSRNDNFMEYLDTLSALGITERLFFWPKAMRKLSAALLIKRNTIFNPNYWGMRFGRNNAVRLIAAVTPFGNYEKPDFGANSRTFFNGSSDRNAVAEQIQGG